MNRVSVRKRSRSGQRGAVLIIGMIMLVLLTMIVISAIRLSSMNLRVIGNQQLHQEAVAAAQQAIEQVATTDFPANPQPASIGIDIDGDGTVDFNVAVATPTCINSVPIKMNDPQLTSSNPANWACYATGAVGDPTGASASNNSLCSNTVWDVSATATDAHGSGATVNVHQGVGKRVRIGTPC